MKYNNTTDQWLECEWDNTIEKDKCDHCGKIPNILYYRQDKPGSSTGDYWCKNCASKTEEWKNSNIKSELNSDTVDNG